MQAGQHWLQLNRSFLFKLTLNFQLAADLSLPTAPSQRTALLAFYSSARVKLHFSRGTTTLQKSTVPRL